MVPERTRLLWGLWLKPQVPHVPESLGKLKTSAIDKHLCMVLYLNLTRIGTSVDWKWVNDNPETLGKSVNPGERATSGSLGLAQSSRMGNFPICLVEKRD